MESAATVVLYPTPAIGHLVPMVEFGKLICTHHPSISVIIFMTSVPYETGSTDKYITSISTTTPSIKFLHLPPIDIPQNLISCDLVEAAFGIPELYNPIFHKTLVSILEKSTIKAVFLDMFSNAAFHISKTSLNLQTYYFYVCGASSLSDFLYFPTTHASDLPPAMLESKHYKHFSDAANNMAKSSGLISNTYEGLEERAVEAIRSGKYILNGPAPPVYLLGPLIANGNQDDHSENECLKWLNSQPSKSVVFLCFGSMGVFKKEQLKEIAIGLERSGQRLLWVVRNPPLDDKKKVTLDDILPQGFLDVGA